MTVKTLAYDEKLEQGRGRGKGNKFATLIAKAKNGEKLAFECASDQDKASFVAGLSVARKNANLVEEIMIRTRCLRDATGNKTGGFIVIVREADDDDDSEE